MNYIGDIKKFVIFGSSSVQSWAEDFSKMDRSDTAFVYCHESLLVENVMSQIRSAGFCMRSDQSLRIHSDHYTLARDVTVAEVLRRRGVAVYAQSEKAAKLGSDKVEMKLFFDGHSIPTPRWGHGTDIPDCGGKWVVKERFGTQAKNINFASSNEIPEGSYFEEFVKGEEVSVIIYSSGNRRGVFPAVWKGLTNEALIPPYKRLRIISSNGSQDRGVEKSMFELSVRIADLIDNEGFLEIEFVVDDRRDIKVLEFNPRVSGTLRMSGLSTGTRVFDPDLTVDGQLPIERCVLEVPHHGSSFSNANEGVYATSRLTVADETLCGALKKLDKYHPDNNYRQIIGGF